MINSTPHDQRVLLHHSFERFSHCGAFANPADENFPIIFVFLTLLLLHHFVWETFYFTEWKTTKQFVLVLSGRSRVVYDPYGMMYTLLPGHIKLLVGVNKSVSNNVSIDRSFQRYLVLHILTNPDRAILTKKQHFGENPLPISLFTILLIEHWICPFPKKLARQKSMKWKTIKWATKPPIKKEKKGKKEFRQVSRKICLSLQNSVLAILMLISGKLVQNLEQKRGISEECGFLARLLSPKSELSSLCFKVGLK